MVEEGRVEIEGHYEWVEGSVSGFRRGRRLWVLVNCGSWGD